jgi:pilus assembly protein CpaC
MGRNAIDPYDQSYRRKNMKKNTQALCQLLMVTCISVSTISIAQELDSVTHRPNSEKLAPNQLSRLAPLNCNGEPAAPSRMTLPLGKSTLLRLPEPVTNRTLGNPAVAQAMLVSPETLYLLGVEIGSTNMIVQGKSGRCSAIDVVVTLDPGALQATLLELMPEEKDIRVSAAADSLILSGTVSDTMVASRVNDLALAYVRRPSSVSPGALQDGMGTTNTGVNAASQSGNLALQQLRVVNLLQVAAAQQVMLEVKVAEVSKALIDKLGVGVQGTPLSGSVTTSILSSFLVGNLGGNLSVTRASGSGVYLDAEKKESLVKVLAEPNVMAISGQEGSFLAGGRILIPVAQDALGRIALEEKEFGIGLRFTPTVLSGGRINLRVSPEVSELSRDGVGIGNGTTQARAILPLITTRRASTTVQLADGQSFAIGGLIKNNSTANIKAFPVLGELPVLGALFRSTDFQNDKTELVFVVTPRLVKPLPLPTKLPTDGLREPSRRELFIDGKLEGNRENQRESESRTSPRDANTGFELK